MKSNEIIFDNKPLIRRFIFNPEWFDSVEAITSLESNVYALYLKDEVYYLRYSFSNQLLGWIGINDKNEITSFYIFEEFRSTKLELILLHAAKELKGYIILPSGQFLNENLIVRMISYPQLFKLSLLHNEKDSSKLLIEGKIGDSPLTGLSAPGVPGINDPLKRSAWTWFKNEK